MPSGKREDAWRTKLFFWDTYIQGVTAKLKLVFISPLVILLWKLLLYFIINYLIINLTY